MSPNLGPLDYTVEEGYVKSYSEKTGKLIDSEVKKIIDSCYDRCKELLLSKKEIIEKYSFPLTL